ncbi:MAG: hypothetical protein CHACPFDD_03364 [Phycisphaerae bacterium]|nr:hypothetical protein [Phycisphaerae bacterium]
MKMFRSRKWITLLTLGAALPAIAASCTEAQSLVGGTSFDALRDSFSTSGQQVSPSGVQRISGLRLIAPSRP